jgi:eukaryotic-like serine/threonine-protein kinase
MRSRVRLAAAVIAVFAIAVAGCDWTTYRGGTTRSGFNSGEGGKDPTAISTGNAWAVHQHWAVPIGGVPGNGNGLFQSSPVVAGGKVYVNAGDGYARAYNAGGAQVWASWTGGSGLNSPPTVANGIVYVASFPASTLYAFNATNGGQIWAVGVSGISIDSTPAVVGGLVYLTAGKGISAYNAANGAFAWSQSGAAVTDTPVAAGYGLVYYGDNNNVVHALSAADGHAVWTKSFTSGFEYIAGLAVADNKVFASSDSISAPDKPHMRALDAGNGTVLWTAVDGGGTAVNTSWAPAVAYGKVYAVTQNGNVRAFDENNGHQVWSVAAGSPTSLSVANGVLFTTTPFRAFDAGNGAQLLNNGLSSAIYDPEPVVANDVVYFSGYNGYLYAFGL